MLAQISADRATADVNKLASFGTRQTLSVTTSDSRGIGAARRWLKAELERYAAESGRAGDVAMQVTFETFTAPADGKRILQPTEIVDVVAVLPGTRADARGRRYLVVGHYDSRATDPLDATSDAPGANDDASGVAVVLELARAMSKERYDATLVFVATAGEEQGLYGARLYAKAARAQGDDIRAVLNDDIVGDPTGSGGGVRRDRVRVFSEGLPADAAPDVVAAIRSSAAESDATSRELARYAVDVAAWQKLAVTPVMIFRPDRLLRGGDHLAFCELGVPAVRFTVPEEHYERQHQNVRVEGGVHYGDVPEFVDGAYVADVARVNAAVLAHLANAPSAPKDARVVASELTNDVMLRWAPSPEATVTGYEVVWRETTSAVWQHAKDVGNVTEVRLPLSKDDLFFGVRAVAQRGYRSPVSFARSAPR
jgi:hypothetical protein